ncbi:MAG: winged helix DNA-binding domain-containing protein [Acidimicrobiia bacterium]
MERALVRPFFSQSDRRERVGRRHLLEPQSRLDSVPGIADALVGLHSSDPATVYLSAGLRMRDPSTDAVERALYDDRTVLRLHGFRNTLWVMTRAMASAMFCSTSLNLAATQTKRLVGLVEANDVAPDAERWVAEAKFTLLAEVEARGTATTRELGAALPDVAVPLSLQGATVSAHTRLMTCLAFEGSIVRTRPQGTWIGSQYVWASMDDWIDGGLDEIDPDTAASAVLAAYLRSFGPVTFKDITWWTGWTVAAARRALGNLQTVMVDTDDGEAIILEGDDERASAQPWVALLPGLDPTTMGWKRRDWYLDPAHTEQLFDRNGNAGPTVWMDGRVVGGWVQASDGEIRLAVLDPEATSRMDEIEVEVQRVLALFGDVRHRPRFPTPTVTALYD